MRLNSVSNETKKLGDIELYRSLLKKNPQIDKELKSLQSASKEFPNVPNTSRTLMRYLYLMRDFGGEDSLLEKHGWQPLITLKRIALHNYFIMGRGSIQENLSFESNHYKMEIDKNNATFEWANLKHKPKAYKEINCAGEAISEDTKFEFDRLWTTEMLEPYERSEASIIINNVLSPVWNSSKKKYVHIEHTPIEEQLRRSYDRKSLQTHLLMLFIKHNPEYLNNEHARINMRIILFHTKYDDYFPLIEELKKDQEGFWKLCQETIQNGIQLNYELQSKQIPKIPQCLFYINLATRLTLLYQQIHQKDPSIPLLPNMKELLDKWMALPNLSEQERFSLHVQNIHHYMQKDPAKYLEDDWSSIYKSWFTLQNSNYLLFSNHDDQHQLTQVKRWMSDLEPKLREKLNKDNALGDKICKTILNLLQLTKDEVQAGSWSFANYPIFTNSFSDNPYEIDLRLGKIKNQYGMIKPGKMKSNENSDFVRLFQNRKFDIQDNEGTFKFYDPLYEGIIEVVNGDFVNGIQRYINGKLYQYVSYKKLKNIKFVSNSLIVDFSHWVSVNPKDGVRKLLFTNRKTSKLFAVWEFDSNKKNPMKIISENLEIELHDNLLPKEIAHFDEENVIVLKELGEKGKRKKILFPRFKTNSEAPLEFYWEGDKENVSAGKWSYANHPDYYLYSPLTPNPFGNFNQYLCLKHKTRDIYKFLVPNLPFKQMLGYQNAVVLDMNKDDADNELIGTAEYFEFDMGESEIECSTVHGKLFLSSLFLLNRDYEKALQTIRKISPSDSITDEEAKKLFSSYMNLLAIAKDYSANACAVLLHAYLLFQTIKPLIKITLNSNNNSDLQIDSVYKLYKCYLNTLNNCPINLSLDPLSESGIRNLLFIKGESREKMLENLEEYNVQIKIPNDHSSNGYDWDNQPLKKLPIINNEEKINWFYIFKDYKYEYVPIIPGELYCIEGNFFVDYETLINPLTKEDDKRSLIYKMSTLIKQRYSIGKSPILDSDIGPILLTFIYRYPDKAPKPLETFTPESFNEWFENLLKIYRATYEQEKSPVKEEFEFFLENDKKVSRFYELPFEPYLSQRKAIVDETNLQLNVEILLSTNNPDNSIFPLMSYFPLKNEEIVPENIENISQHHSMIFDDELSDEDRIYEEVIKAECNLYDEEYQKGSELNKIAKKEIINIPENLNSIENLQNEVEKAKLLSNEHTEKLSKVIEKYINLIPIDKKNGILKKESILKLGGVVSNILPIECYRAVAQSSEQESFIELRKLNPYLTDRDCEIICKLVIHFLIEETVRKQLERASLNLKELVELKSGNVDDSKVKLQMKILWNKIYTILNEKRTYDPFKYPQPDEPQHGARALIFEALSGLRVRPKQIDKINEVFKKLFKQTKDNFGVVFQLIMGGGKTSVILSQLIELVSNEKKLPLFLCHHSQYATVLGNLKEFQKSRYNKEIVKIDFTREELSKKETLDYILNQLNVALAKKSPIIMKTSMLQILELELLSLGDDLTKTVDQNHTKELWGNLEKLAQILNFIKENCVGLFDEIDINLNVMQGVHFPKGLKVMVNQDQIMHVKKIYEILVSDELKDVTKLTQNRQDELSADDYTSKVLPILGDKLSKLPELMLSPQHKDAFVRYVSGKISFEREQEALAADFKIPEGSLQNEIEDIHFLRYLHIELPSNKDEDQFLAADLISLANSYFFSVNTHSQ